MFLNFCKILFHYSQLQTNFHVPPIHTYILSPDAVTQFNLRNLNGMWLLYNFDGGRHHVHYMLYSLTEVIFQTLFVPHLLGNMNNNCEQE